MIMNVVLMPSNQIIGSCGERNLIALDFNYSGRAPTLAAGGFQLSAENQRESAGCSQFVFVFTSVIQWANRRRFYDLTNLFPETR